jgi:hypothetical protein
MPVYVDGSTPMIRFLPRYWLSAVPGLADDLNGHVSAGVANLSRWGSASWGRNTGRPTGSPSLVGHQELGQTLCGSTFSLRASLHLPRPFQGKSSDPSIIPMNVELLEGEDLPVVLVLGVLRLSCRTCGRRRAPCPLGDRSWVGVARVTMLHQPQVEAGPHPMLSLGRLQLFELVRIQDL